MPGGNDGVPAVIAFAGEEENIFCISLPEEFGGVVSNGAAGSFHQFSTGSTGGDGALVDGAHLVGGDRFHTGSLVGKSWICNAAQLSS